MQLFQLRTILRWQNYFRSILEGHCMFSAGNQCKIVYPKQVLAIVQLEVALPPRLKDCWQDGPSLSDNAITLSFCRLLVTSLLIPTFLPFFLQ